MTIPKYLTKSTAYDFAITLTVSDRRIKKLSSSQQYEKMYDIIQSFFKPFFRSTVLCELHKSCDVHFHGIFQPKEAISLDQLNYNIKNRIKMCYPQFDTRNVVIKVVDDYTGWTSYICKHIDTTRKLLKKEPFIIDQYNLNHLAIYGEDVVAERCVQHKEGSLEETRKPSLENEVSDIAKLDAIGEGLEYIESLNNLKISYSIPNISYF